MRKGRLLQSGAGCPQVLDEESYKRCVNEIIRDSVMSGVNFTMQIIEECTSTNKRKHANASIEVLAADDTICISARSSKRYLSKLQS